MMSNCQQSKLNWINRYYVNIDKGEHSLEMGNIYL